MPEYSHAARFSRSARLHRLRLIGLLVVLGPLLATCGHVPVASMVQLRAFDLKTTDPVQLMIAVGHPHWIRIPQGGAAMVIEERGTPEGDVVQRDEIVFERVTDVRKTGQLAVERQSGTTLTVFSVPRADVHRLRSVQRRLGARRTHDASQARGSLSVSVKGCRVGSARDGPVPVSTYLAASEFEGFVPLLRDFDLRAAMIEAGAPVENAIASCDTAAEDDG
ncbi:hypothetical protein [Stappia stellulata]|uniref:hypothetical protein n=1 Tax=Stappia stellulata TaxID=71235 RepID=UPI00040D72ED|nr:hypothetical protein [Stappia stellulata]